MKSLFNRKHNNYISTPDWFENIDIGQQDQTKKKISDSNITMSSSFIDFKTLPIDNNTIVWNEELLSIPIDNDKLKIVNGKLTITGGVVTIKNYQEIEDVKNFKKGIQINGIALENPQEDVIFINSNLVVRGGITVYAGDEHYNVPSIYDGLPIDWQTIYWENVTDEEGNVIGKVLKAAGGGGSGEGGITIEQLAAYLDMNKYATQSWVEEKGYLTSISKKMVTDALNYTPLDSTKFTKDSIKSTLGISDWALTSEKPSYTTKEIAEDTNLYFTNARAVSALTETLKNYVTLAGQQTITGEKNFTGGLKVHGNPIVYDATNKYWKFEGDLLVTGGVTMYGNDSDFVPSTIMDAIQYDSSTLGINSNGQLYVKGGTGGIVGDYLPLGGGTLTGKLTTQTNAYYSDSNYGINLANSDIVGVNSIYFNDLAQDNAEGLLFARTNGNWDVLRSDDGVLKYAPNYTISAHTTDAYTVWHSGNDGSGSGLDADLLDGYDSTKFLRYEGYRSNGNSAASAQTITYWGEGSSNHGYTYGTSLNIQAAGTWNHRLDFRTDGYLDYYQGINTGAMTFIGTIAYLTSNVASANKLKTARLIWGQSFDGTGNVSGDISVGSSSILFSSGRIANCSGVSEANTTSIIVLKGKDDGNLGYVGYFQDHFIFCNYRGGIENGGFSVYENGNITTFGNGNFGVGVNNPSVKLHVGGNILATGGITMYSDIRKKTKLKEVELSLKQIADAPLIEHYYNSDEKKTTHVGSIAQYWAGMNDWFCKLDNDGYYTMEIQNAALASAISIAREFVKYESKTDKKIRLLKERVKKLEDKIEKLENN